jgi:drug/metabolite transporter (DMT)-like permease
VNNADLLRSYLLAFLAVFLSATSQALLKSGVRRVAGRSFIWVYANLYSIVAYALFGISTLLCLYAYKILPLKVSAMLSPFMYIFVGLYSHFVLKEKMTRRQAWGAAIILLGVVVYNLSPR